MRKLYLNIFLLLFLSPTLFSQTLKCAYCGKKVESSYITFEGETYHERCYKNYIQFRCAKCGQAINDSFVMFDGKRYHEKCYTESVALRCALCNKIIEGTYTTDYWGNIYHISHEKDEVRCDYCGRFISGHLTKGGLKFSDGRVICGLCKATSVNSLTKAQTILNSVKNSLQSLGVKINYNKIDIELVNKDELKKIASESGGVTDPRGFAKYTYWKTNGKTSKQEFTIYILNGMPQKEFEAVTAHELMHVWQYINSPENPDPQLTEGSAEYVSFLLMNNQRDEFSKYIVHKIEANRDPTYGEGFRRVKRVVDNNGLNYLLNHLRNSNNFPNGY